MSDVRDPDSSAESEFGLAQGMIDETLRVQREIPSYMEGWEIAALPKSFDGSYPNRPEPEETPVPRLLPGETEADRE